MNDVVFRPSGHPCVNIYQDAVNRPGSSRQQDPAIILIVALSISFATLVVATGWLLIRG